MTLKKLNKMLSCLLLLCMILALPLGAAASEDIGFDEDQDCTLEILIENESDQDLPVADADVTLYKVADVKMNKDTVSYPCTSDFTGYAKALEIQPNDPDVNFNAGVAALADNDLDKAEEFFGKAAGSL